MAPIPALRAAVKKLPQFWDEKPEEWFHMAEVYLDIHTLTDDEDK